MHEKVRCQTFLSEVIYIYIYSFGLSYLTWLYIYRNISRGILLTNKSILEDKTEHVSNAKHIDLVVAIKFIFKFISSNSQ